MININLPAGHSLLKAKVGQKHKVILRGRVASVKPDGIGLDDAKVHHLSAPSGGPLICPDCGMRGKGPYCPSCGTRMQATSKV